MPFLIYAKRAVAKNPLLKGSTVTGNVYATKILPEVVKHYKAASPRTGTRGTSNFMTRNPRTSLPWLQNILRCTVLKLCHILHTAQIKHHVTFGLISSSKVFEGGDLEAGQQLGVLCFSL